MPLYFAYGANMDAAAMRLRCPRSRLLGKAKLARHRFGLMRDGYATVVRDARSDTHGLLYDLALADVAALDRYEEVAGGLYQKVVQPVLRESAGAVRALVYLGMSPAVADPPILPGYTEALVAAAIAAALPDTYVASLESLCLRRAKSVPTFRSIKNGLPLRGQE